MVPEVIVFRSPLKSPFFACFAPDSSLPVMFQVTELEGQGGAAPDYSRKETSLSAQTTADQLKWCMRSSRIANEVPLL
jgi:hypothetical protein